MGGGMAASDVMLTLMPLLNLKPNHGFTTDTIPSTTDTILAKDLLMPKPNQKASHGTMVDMVVMEDGMAANAVLLTLNLSLKLRANHTTTTGIIHIMLDTTILARDQLMLSQNHIGEDMVDTVDMVDITGVRTTKDNETDLS